MADIVCRCSWTGVVVVGWGKMVVSFVVAVVVVVVTVTHHTGTRVHSWLALLDSKHQLGFFDVVALCVLVCRVFF